MIADRVVRRSEEFRRSGGPAELLAAGIVLEDSAQGNKLASRA